MGTSAFKMCFSQEMSGMFSVLGALFALWVAKTNGNSNVVKGVMYFVAMETLQFVQYMFIATDVDPAHPTLSQIEASPTCKSSANRFLTFLGLLHIAFQPFYSAHLSCAFVTSEKNVAQFELVKRLQLVGGVLLLCRYFFTLFDLRDFGVTDERYLFDAKAWDDKVVVEWLSCPPWDCTPSSCSFPSSCWTREASCATFLTGSLEPSSLRPDPSWRTGSLLTSKRRRPSGASSLSCRWSVWLAF